MKIENRSLNWGHKLNGIGGGRIRTFPFLSIPLTTSSLMVSEVNTRLSEWEAEAEEPVNRKAWSRTLPLVYSSASACDIDNAVFTS